MNYKPLKVLISFLILTPMHLTRGEGRQQVFITGSSTIYPFAVSVAENLAFTSNYPTPIIEQSGTGIGIKQFCAGVGIKTPDIVLASRPMTSAEINQCHANKVKQFTQLIIGGDAILLVQQKGQEPMNITQEEVFLALAKWVPLNNQWVKNPYQQWSEINPRLPKKPIRVMAPPNTSGTREVFNHALVEKGCKSLMAQQTGLPKDGKNYCLAMREDGVFSEGSENHNLLVQKVQQDKNLITFIPFNFFETNNKRVQTLGINGVKVELGFVDWNQYALFRPLYMYVKKDNMPLVSGMIAYIDEFFSEDAMDKEEGYLTKQGLITLKGKDMEGMKKNIQLLPNMEKR